MSNLAPAASPHVLTAGTPLQRGESRWRVIARTAFPFLVVALAWEATAHAGIFPRKLFPPLEDVAGALLRLTATGILPHHVLDTLLRLIAGFALAAAAALASGDPARRAALCTDRIAAGFGAGLAHPGRGGDARRSPVGPRLDDFRRARVLEHRRDARRGRGDRRNRACAGETRVPTARAVHRRSLGDDVVSAATKAAMERATSAYRAGITLLLAAACYEAVARSGVFPAALLPTLPKIASTLWALLLDGTMLEHAGFTMYRVLFGLALAVAVALPLGILMGRFRPVENFCLPLASALMPIPSLAWVPLFILWFGLGNTVAILIVFYAALFPMLLNTWSGVRAVNPLWLHAAGAMGADERVLFWKVIIPGASPFIITGLRQAFLRAWIAVVGAEMLAASDWGLGLVIFDAKEFLNADVMLAALAVIGAIGFVFERLVFGSLERATVMRWGMVRTAKG